MTVVSFLTGCEDGSERVDAYPFRRVDFAWPYLLMCMMLALGEFIGFTATTACRLWPAVLAMFLGWVMVGYGWAVPKWHHFAVFMLGLSLAMYSESRRAMLFDQSEYSSSPVECELPVESRIRWSSRYLSFDSSSNGVDVRVMMRYSDPMCASNAMTDCGIAAVPEVGENWRCRGWLERKPRGDRTRRNLWICGRAGSAECLSEASDASLGAWLRRMREELSENIGYGLGHDPLAANLDRAMILGQRSDLPRETRQVFADAGTVHVFAISGLHVGIVAWVLVCFLMTFFFFPLRWVAIPLAPLLCGYVMMIESPPSAVRAAFMSIVYFSAPMFLRKSDSLIAWAITFMIFHILNPAMLMKVGSLLSFIVMLGILLFIRWAEVFKSNRLTSWGVSVAAWLSGVAIAARAFERITIGGLLANIVMIPLASFAVVLGFLGAVAGFFSTWLASHLNNAAALLIDAMTGISWITAMIPYSNLVVAPWPLWMCAVWYAMLVMTFWLIRSVYLHRREII